MYRLRDKLEFILRATFQHARNLALLATSYKVLCFLLRKAMGRQHPLQNFVSAAISGYFVFGENNKINMQVRGGGVPKTQSCDLGLGRPGDEVGGGAHRDSCTTLEIRARRM